ncbi:hypothetical protein [Streptomyces sp. HNM0575]|uniref:hypothetical protein n=1 Tax=Streptomyces sp. HNM0575 TaxID=2716338 RepID=UPI001F0F811C|nr:hypothetical protein [Streptomyces sp. HNM0575]
MHKKDGGPLGIPELRDGQPDALGGAHRPLTGTFESGVETWIKTWIKTGTGLRAGTRIETGTDRPAPGAAAAAAPALVVVLLAHCAPQLSNRRRTGLPALSAYPTPIDTDRHRSR